MGRGGERGLKEGEGRERKRDRERQRETERDRGRQRERERQRETERQRERERETETETETETERERERERLRVRVRERGTSCMLLLLTPPPYSPPHNASRFETVFQGLGELLEVERATLFLLDPESQMLWSQIAKDETGKQLEIKVPLGSGVVGHVAKTGQVNRLFMGVNRLFVPLGVVGHVAKTGQVRESTPHNGEWRVTHGVWYGVWYGVGRGAWGMWR